MSSRNRRHRGSLGQALVESSIVVLLMIVLSFTIFDFGHFFWALLTFQHAVSTGTRFAVTNSELPDMSRDESIRHAIKEATPGFAVDNDDISFYNVTADSPGAGGPNDVVRVTVEHDFSFLTPGIEHLFEGGRLRFQVSSTMRNEPPPFE